VKKAARVGLLNTLQSNAGLADLLASYHVVSPLGSWRAMVEELEDLEELTPRDCMRVAEAVFHPDNCVRGLVHAKSSVLA
jgi:predicted Zn-dependent peptidase